MKLTLFLALALVLLVNCWQTANCQESGYFSENTFIPQTDYANYNYGQEPLPYYFQPKQYPSGVRMSYGRDPISTSAGDFNPSYENRRAFSPDVPVRVNSRALTPDSVKDEELLQLSEILYSKENSQINQMSVNPQGKTRSIDTDDKAPEHLLQVNEKALMSPTIAKLRPLFNNYEMDTSVEEIVTPEKLQEQDDFLDAVMATNVMRQAMLFLQDKGMVSSSIKSQRDLLKTIWFGLYSRGQGILGSSGFEHVFLNEVNRGKIIGLHNWVYFNEEEKAGRLDYKGYLNKIDLGNKGKLIMARFTHNGLNKPVNSLFVGTSPELEIALYTICFQLRADEKCPVSLGGKGFTIQTYTWRYNGNKYIASAYPSI